MKLHVQHFTFNPFQENTYLVYSDNGDAVIIDPGCYDRSEEKTLTDFIEAKNLKVLALLNTHAHIDHIMGNAMVVEKYQVDYYLHILDLEMLKMGSSTAQLYGFPNYKESPLPNKELKNEEIIQFGDIQFQVLFTPGHSPGHVVFYNAENNFVINGDVLFQGSFGRVDLPGGNIETLKNSIFNVLFKLPEETVIYCGHGPSTKVEIEKKYNYIHNF